MTRPGQQVIKVIPRPENLRSARQRVAKAADYASRGRSTDALEELIFAVDQILKSLEARHD
jgi:hypothetical protein